MMGSDSAYGEKFFGKPPKKELEKCISCGKETKYSKDTPIDFRENYVEGAGQLCDGCANKIYK